VALYTKKRLAALRMAWHRAQSGPTCPLPGPAQSVALPKSILNLLSRKNPSLKEQTLTQAARNNLPTLKKTASYYLVHIMVAALVAYAVTDS
jgi:hypothetical protein